MRSSVRCCFGLGLLTSRVGFSESISKSSPTQLCSNGGGSETRPRAGRGLTASRPPWFLHSADGALCSVPAPPSTLHVSVFTTGYQPSRPDGATVQAVPSVRAASDLLGCGDGTVPFAVDLWAPDETAEPHSRRVIRTPAPASGCLPLEKPSTEPPWELEWSGYVCYCQTPFGDRSLSVPAWPKRTVPGHHAATGTWALSQLPGLSGGQLLAAALGAGPWGPAVASALQAVVRQRETGASSLPLSEPGISPRL